MMGWESEQAYTIASPFVGTAHNDEQIPSLDEAEDAMQMMHLNHDRQKHTDTLMNSGDQLRLPIVDM